jgi:hypothetical protein
MNRIFLAILLVAALSSCRHGSLDGGFYTKSETRYYVGQLPAGWRRVDFQDNDLAYVSEDGQHVIATNATCKEYEDAPLKVLLRHLLMGFTEPKTLNQETKMLDGREALFSHSTAKLDGIPRELSLVVMKKDGCIYDFMQICPVGQWDRDRAAFDQLLQQFRTEPRR